MSTMMFACRVFGQEVSNFVSSTISVFSQVPRRCKYQLVKKPKIGAGKAFRRIVHFEDKYTVKPLKITNLGGRDSATGRVAVKGIGGGIKHKYHWINWIRDGPTDLSEPPKEEKVLEIFKDATENMKPGDIIRTHQGIPRNPIRPSEGDAYPLGALPIGTQIHSIEKYPGQGGWYIHSAGSVATILKREEDRVVILMPKRKTFSLHETCMATVGRLSNIEHGSTPIGSAQKNRELGNRPRSGLWQRKTGRFGRKIKPPPKTKRIDENREEKPEVLVFNSKYNA
ncbi:39S ribosomal protein L2, mitochondrial [Camponotus japonicus]